ncbi:MAG: hypothetical protein CR982_10345 [Candidatus Cloacimonadota bacterium]|nr:MAG: hypothetical protein CR982_10345 [Candidatus Cloacimonadota bacterium]PIE79102.1 MAG: hypothetical protein CSA15_04310 [Candidatus Delongbacteria bacterium]
MENTKNLTDGNYIKRTTTFIILFFITFLLTSCFEKNSCTIVEKNGVKIFNNSNKNSKKSVNFKPQLVRIINKDQNSNNYLSHFDLDAIGLDSYNNIFIADMGNEAKVNKYDKNGNFIKRFVQRGSGPGEVSRISFLCTKNDTVYIGDLGTGSISIFDTNGNYIDKINPKGYLFQVKAVGNNKFTGDVFSSEIVGKKSVLCRKTLLMNNRFEMLKELDKNYMSNGENADLQDEFLHLSVAKDKIYLAVNNKNRYEVKAFNFEGTHIETIHKSYSAIKFSKEEIKKMNLYLKKVYGDRKLNEKNVDKKFAIAGVYSDKNSNLIVQPSVDTNNDTNYGLKLDYYQNNECLGSTTIPTKEPYFACDYNILIRFMGDYMYMMDGTENTLNIYKY